MAIDLTTMERTSYRVRIVRHGQVCCTVYIDEYDTACEWAYEEMDIRRLREREDVVYGAVIESGIRLEDLVGSGRTIFLADKQLREGLVLDIRSLKKYDTKFLFGLA